jgi:hypothetical protein
MVAHEKSIWFGCMLASLFVLVLAGCSDVSESGSSQMAQPSEKSPPTNTAESHAAAGGGPAAWSEEGELRPGPPSGVSKV